MDDPGGQPFGLAPLQLADKHHFDDTLRALGLRLSDYSFANCFIWSASLKLYWKLVHRHMCLFANGTGDLTMLLPPIPQPGAGTDELRQAVGECFDIMDAYNRDVAGDVHHSRIEYISDEMLERLNSCTGFDAGQMRLSAAPMSSDYIYDMARMIDLAGGNLKSKRHARSKFMRDYPNHRTATLTEALVPECLALLDLWVEHGDAVHLGETSDVAHLGTDVLRHRDHLACQNALRHFATLGLEGMVLLVDDKVVGFTLGEALSATQASILIEKTHPDYHGAPQFIFSEFCRLHWSHLAECNVGDDWGIPSLRFTKQSYRPTRLLSKYTLARPQSCPLPAVMVSQTLTTEADVAPALHHDAPAVTLQGSMSLGMEWPAESSLRLAPSPGC